MSRLTLLAAALLICAAPAIGQTVSGRPIDTAAREEAEQAMSLARAAMQRADGALATAKTAIGPVGPTGPAGPAGVNGRDGLPGARGADGVPGAPGIAGPRGADGLPGTPGAAGIAGAAGKDGGLGQQGATGLAATVAIGTVTTGAAGSSAAVSNTGTAGAAVLSFTIPRGATGATGAQGPAGSGVTQIGLVTLGETATVAIALGPRRLTAAIPCVVGDRLLIVPNAQMPAGYMLGDAFCVTDGSGQLTVFVPALAVGTSYSVPVRVLAIR